MNYSILNPELRRRLIRTARIVDRADRWSRLAFMETDEAERLLREHEEEEEANRVSEPEPNDKKSCSTPGSSARKSPFAVTADAPQDTSKAYAPEVEDDLDGELDDDDMLAETVRTDEANGTHPLSQDDGTYPVGPRSEKNKSRYQVQPGHGQGLSDLLRSTASVRALRGIAKLLNE